MSVLHITANSRLSQTLKRAFYLQQDQAVGETPQVMTLPQWWQQWQEEALFMGALPKEEAQFRVLSAFEAQWLWERLLSVLMQEEQAETPLSLSLLNVSQTAKQLYQAWCLWQEWLPVDTRESMQTQHYDSDEIALFLRLAERYQQKLTQSNWRDASTQQAWLLTQLQNSSASMRKRLPQRVELHGFDEFPPAMLRWQALLKEQGCEIVEHGVSTSQIEQLSRFRAQDRSDEVQQVATWCLQQWRELSKSSTRSVRIGVVCPNVSDYKSLLQQSLTELWAQEDPNALPLQSGQWSAPFNISLGLALTDIPLVQNALLTLKLFGGGSSQCAYPDWSAWLVSPYSLGTLTSRHELDAYLRRKQWHRINWQRLAQTEESSGWIKQQQSILSQWAEQHARMEWQQLSLTQFVESVQTLLQQLQWAQSRILASTEYQQKEAFTAHLQAFASLQDVFGKQSYQAWLNLFSRYCRESIHQPQSQPNAPVQIMGTLEAGGQQFDALWVMGLTDEAWPRPANPNPFLPADLQRQHRTPRCDASKELAYAQQVTQRLLAAAPIQVWSDPRFDKEAEWLSSPLLSQTPFEQATDYEAQNFQGLAAFSYAKRVPLEWVKDTIGAPVEEGTYAPGGVGILQAQSKCPLMAYLDYRLGGRYGLERIEDGLPSTNQGTLVHAVLQYFWDEMQTQSALFALEDETLRDSLKQHIAEQFKQLEQGFDEHYLQLEQNRILEVLWAWLQQEKLRQPFKVLETEFEAEVELAGIRFKVIVDRIDQVESDVVIVDYKTGQASAKDLLSQPLKAPQLAMYLWTLQPQQTVSALGYGLLHSDTASKYNMVVEDKEQFGLEKSRSLINFTALSQKEGGDWQDVAWSDFVTQLKQDVLDLAASIQQGEAPLVFEKESAVEYAACHLALRLPEARAQGIKLTEQAEGSEA